MNGGCFKNQCCHSERSEESHFLSFFKRRDPSALRPQDDGQGQTCKNFWNTLIHECYYDE
jgi:hypothetical protein